MRIRQALHTVIHKGLYQPRSHRKKRDYKIGDVIGQSVSNLFLEDLQTSTLHRCRLIWQCQKCHSAARPTASSDQSYSQRQGQLQHGVFRNGSS